MVLLRCVRRARVAPRAAAARRLRRTLGYPAGGMRCPVPYPGVGREKHTSGAASGATACPWISYTRPCHAIPCRGCRPARRGRAPSGARPGRTRLLTTRARGAAVARGMRTTGADSRVATCIRACLRDWTPVLPWIPWQAAHTRAADHSPTGQCTDRSTL